MWSLCLREIQERMWNTGTKVPALATKTATQREDGSRVAGIATLCQTNVGEEEPMLVYILLSRHTNPIVNSNSMWQMVGRKPRLKIGRHYHTNFTPPESEVTLCAALNPLQTSGSSLKN